MECKFCYFCSLLQTAKHLSSSPESTKTSSKAGCSLSTLDTPYGEPLPLESMSSINSPQIEESGLHPSILSIPQSQSAQQSSEAPDPVYNVHPSVSFSVPAVLVHSYDRQETNNNELEESGNPNQLSHPQNGMLEQVPFEFGQPSLAASPNTTHTQEEDLKEFQEKKDVLEIYDKLSDIQEEPSQNIDGDKTCIHRSEDPTQTSSSKKMRVATEDVEKLILSEGLENPLNEEGLKDFQEKEDIVEIEDRLADIQEKPSQNIEEGKMHIHRSEFPKQLPPSTQLNVANVDLEKRNLSEFLENPLDEEPKQPSSSIQANVATEDVEKLSLSDGLEDPLEEGLKDFQENVHVVEMVDSLADILEEPSQNTEEDETCIQLFEEPKLSPSSKEINIATGDAEKPSDGSEHPLEEGIEEQEVDLGKHEIETTKVLEVESSNMIEEESNALVASYLSPLYLDTTVQERETQSILIHPTKQEEGLLDPSTLASMLPEDPKDDNQTASMCTTEHPTSQPEKPALVSGSETSPRAFNHQPSTVQTSAEDDLTSEADELSQEACKDLEPQHTLPRVNSEPSQISKDQAEVSLSTCLMVSAIFFSAVICLAVGIQEPSAFLCVGLFLLSLWF